MPKIYTDYEKNLHKTVLYEKGMEFFNEHGFKNINIDKMVGLIGVSKGYFYLLFNSKEEFFLEALLWKMKKNYQNLCDLRENGSSQKDLIEAYKNQICSASYAKMSDYVHAYSKINPQLWGDFQKAEQEHFTSLLKLFGKDSSVKNVRVLCNLVSTAHFAKVINYESNHAFRDASEETLKILLKTISDYVESLPDSLT